jgi:hypothetical protein
MDSETIGACKSSHENCSCHGLRASPLLGQLTAEVRLSPSVLREAGCQLAGLTQEDGGQHQRHLRRAPHQRATCAQPDATQVPAIGRLPMLTTKRLAGNIGALVRLM